MPKTSNELPKMYCTVYRLLWLGWVKKTPINKNHHQRKGKVSKCNHPVNPYNFQVQHSVFGFLQQVNKLRS